MEERKMLGLKQNKKIFIPKKGNLYATNQYGDCSIYYYTPLISFFYVKRIKMLADLLPRNGKYVLDAGCGSGVLFYQLKNIFSNLHGIDLRPDIYMVKKTLSTDGVKVNLINGDLLHLPYKDASFDCVVSMSVLEHIIHLEQPIKEIKRVLKSEGRFICGFPVKNFLMHQFFKIINFDDEKDHPSGHKYIYEILNKNFRVEKTIKFPNFLKMDNCLYVACLCKN